jgi:hypothetical protein
MSKKKVKRSGFESADKLNSCVSCDRIHDVKLGGWVILASGELICDPVDRHDCWEKLVEKKQNEPKTRRRLFEG